MPYIYKITNDINQKVYIGKTSSTIEQRWKNHIKDSQTNTKEKRPLYAAIRKYGIEHFHIEQIEEVINDEAASEREVYWIEHYGSFKNGYNATIGGDGRKYADYDLIFSLFTEGKSNKEIIQITGYSDKTVTTALNQFNISHKERVDRSHLKESVFMLDKDTSEILKVFSSMTEAEKYLNKNNGHQHISEVCAGKRKTAYGYKWRKATI